MLKKNEPKKASFCCRKPSTGTKVGPHTCYDLAIVMKHPPGIPPQVEEMKDFFWDLLKTCIQI